MAFRLEKPLLMFLGPLYLLCDLMIVGVACPPARLLLPSRELVMTKLRICLIGRFVSLPLFTIAMM